MNPTCIKPTSSTHLTNSFYLLMNDGVWSTPVTIKPERDNRHASRAHRAYKRPNPTARAMFAYMSEEI